MPTLSESESKRLLAAFGVPVVADRLVADPEEAEAAADEFGGPVVVKLCGAAIAHKTERGLVRLGVEGAAVRQAAATFATQPLPAGPRVAVVTTAGGWGVVTADTVSRAPGLELAPLPDDLRSALDAVLPPRWSRNNPIDPAGGESKDTVPHVLELVTRHPGVDAVVFLGLGIQGNQGRLERSGPFYPGHGLDRIVAYHERQERRYAQTAAALAGDTGKPVLCATELAMGDAANPAVAGVRESGKLCYPSANRAVTALAHLWRHARWRRRRGL